MLYQRVRPAILARQSSILVGVTLTGSMQIVLQALTFWHQPWAMQLVAQHNKSIEDPDSLLIDLVDGVLSLAAKYSFERGVRTAQIRKCFIYMCIRDPCGSTHRDRFGIPVIQPTGIPVGQPTARTHRDPCIKRR